MPKDHNRTVLSSEQERRHSEFVGGPEGYGLAVDGEKASAVTGPEWPTSRREDDGWVSGLSLGEVRGLPSMDHTRM